MNNFKLTFIDCLSSKYFFWNVVLFYCISKLCPIINKTNIFTILVFIISVFVFILRMIKLVFITKKITINYYRLLTLLIFALGVSSYLVDSKFSFKLLFHNRDFSPIVTLFVNFIVLFVVEEQDPIDAKMLYFNKITNLMLYFSFIYSLITLISTFLLNKIRPEGLAGSVINYSHFTLCATTFSLCALIFNLNDAKKKYFCIFCIIFQIFMLLYDQQRNGYLGLFIGTIVFIYILNKTNNLSKLLGSFNFKTKKKYIFIVIFFAILIALAFLTRKYNVVNKFLSMSTSGRIDIWKTTFLNFSENNMLFGFGGSSFSKATEFLKRYPEINEDPYMVEYLELGWNHNTYLSHLYEYGFINFIFIFGFVFLYVSKFFKYIKENSSSRYIIIFITIFSYSVIAPLFMAIFDENLFTGYFSFDNLLFLMFASFILESENNVIK